MSVAWGAERAPASSSSHRSHRSSSFAFARGSVAAATRQRHFLASAFAVAAAARNPPTCSPQRSHSPPNTSTDRLGNASPSAVILFRVFISRSVSGVPAKFVCVKITGFPSRIRAVASFRCCGSCDRPREDTCQVRGHVIGGWCSHVSKREVDSARKNSERGRAGTGAM